MVLSEVRGRVVGNRSAEGHALLQVVEALCFLLVLGQHFELVALAVGDHLLLAFPLEVETTANHELLRVGKVGGELLGFLRKNGSVLGGDAEVLVDLEESVLGPLAGQLVPVEVAHVACALFRRHVKQFMGLDHPHLLCGLQPQTPLFVLLPRGVPAAATQAVVLEPYCHLGLPEGVTNLLAPENHTVEVFAKYLSGLVIDLVLRVDHDDILGPALVEYAADGLGVAAVDEY